MALETGSEVEEDLETGEPAGFVASRNGTGEGGAGDHKGWPIDLVAQVDTNWAYRRSITEPEAYGVREIVELIAAIGYTESCGRIGSVKGGCRR